MRVAVKVRLLQFVVNTVNCRNDEGAVTALKKTVTDFNDHLTVAENSKIYSPASNVVVHPGADRADRLLWRIKVSSRYN